VSEEPRVAIARRVFEGWERGDFGADLELLADDIEVSWAEPPTVTWSHGRQEASERLVLLFRQWDGFRAVPEEMIPVGDSSVLVVARQSGTGKESGVEVDARTHVVITVRDGRIAAVHWHFDRRAALEAAGIRA
jgi:ketosteroid isomerase-like protein